MILHDYKKLTLRIEIYLIDQSLSKRKNKGYMCSDIRQRSQLIRELPKYNEEILVIIETFQELI